MKWIRGIVIMAFGAAVAVLCTLLVPQPSKWDVIAGGPTYMGEVCGGAVLIFLIVGAVFLVRDLSHRTNS